MTRCHLSDRAFEACQITPGLVAVGQDDVVVRLDRQAQLRPDARLYLNWCQHHDHPSDLGSAIPTYLEWNRNWIRIGACKDKREGKTNLDLVV